MGVLRSLFLIEHLHLVGVSLGDNLRTKIHKGMCLNEIGMRSRILLTTSQSKVEEHMN